MHFAQVGVKVDCEDLSENKRKRVCEVFMTFVALDSDHKKVIGETRNVVCRSSDSKLSSMFRL